MGLFNKKKKNTEEHHETNNFDYSKDVGSFAGFVLLSEPEWDRDRFVRDFKEDWGIEIVEDDHVDDPDDGKLVYANVEGMRVVVGLIEAPVPDGEAEYWAQGNYMWKDGVEVVKKHKAQLIVCVLSETDDIIAKGKLFVKLAASALNQGNALAFYNEGAVFPPDMYRAFAEPMKNGELPYLCWVWFGLYGNEKESGVYTYGMRRFGKQEMETYVPRETADLNRIRGFMLDIAAYVLSGNVTLKDGETIGFSAEQKLPIKLSKGIAVDGETLKITYGE
ncbi:MAG: DUF4261 domain-containing protein [Oscillospiraceae bacterium]|nr:DUF4261 domain-containing protein [Oscillospiraceae bacterium]